MWTRVQDVRRVLSRLWDRGELLRDSLSEQSADSARFPLRILVKGPRSSDMIDDFQGVREWVNQFANSGAPFRIEWVQVRNRVQGNQRLPACVWVDSLEIALSWLGKERDVARFLDLVSLTRDTFPELVPWMARYPLRVLDLLQQWSRLLSVLRWLRAHPRPAVYLRQVDIPGVHTKFIESHRSVLAELADCVLLPEHVDASQTGVNRFAGRYGFLDKPVRMRFRLLDPKTQLLDGVRCPDITLDTHSFSSMNPDIDRVVITENEVNFLALPSMPRTMAIFGSGYGWESFAQVRWLDNCRIDYWGDIDTHGFAILDQLRRYHPHARSVLMDRETLLAHKSFWGQESRANVTDLGRLTHSEQALYDDLRHDRLGQAVRLEQEFVGYRWAYHHLTAASD